MTEAPPRRPDAASSLEGGTASTRILRVAVASPLRRLFDYLPPASGPRREFPGTRVRVPFGRGTRVGVVVEEATTSHVEPARLRRVQAVLDEEALLAPADLSLLMWSAAYYHHPPGQVLVGTLPGPLRRGQPLPGPAPRYHLCAGAESGATALGRRAPRQAALIERLRAHPEGLDAAALAADGGDWRKALRALVERGLVESRAPEPTWPEPASGRPTLNRAQADAVATVRAFGERFGALLLDGVTGSGKTEVYLELIAGTAAAGRQALVLIPEIGLTPQIVERFRSGLGLPVAVLHSGLAEGERVEAWVAARAGRAPLVIGTRSAVFVPLARPGLLIVDEEHDLSFKQQDGFRYCARDVAVARARRLDVPVVLGSATPSLESMQNVRTGRYATALMPRRATGADAPTVELFDLRGQQLDGGLGESLLDAVGAVLAAREQGLLFLNRRGYAPLLMCRRCGWPAECARCDAHLVYHRAIGRLRCHHCGAEREVPAACPDCGADALQPVGAGTQRVVEALARRFPEARIERFDRDRTRRRGALESLLEAIHAGAVDLLVGTQMLAKGHHFPNVTLVGIVDADGGLFGADFRALERMAQLLVQVAGRAGRGARPGRVLIQTHHPGHPLLQTLVARGYREFGEAALEERRAAGLPPCTHVVLLRAEAARQEAVRRFLGDARRLAADLAAGRVRTLGPVPAPMERRLGRYRMHLWIEADERRPLHAFLDDWLPAIERHGAARRVRWSLDVDPQETL